MKSYNKLRSKIITRANECKQEADRLGTIADREYANGQEAVAAGFERQSLEQYVIVAELMLLLA